MPTPAKIKQTVRKLDLIWSNAARATNFRVFLMSGRLVRLKNYGLILPR